MSVARKTISKLMGGLFVCIYLLNYLFWKHFLPFPWCTWILIWIFLVLPFTPKSPLANISVGCQLASGRRYFLPVLYGQYFLTTSGKRDLCMWEPEENALQVKLANYFPRKEIAKDSFFSSLNPYNPSWPLFKLGKTFPPLCTFEWLHLQKRN